MCHLISADSFRLHQRRTMNSSIDRPESIASCGWRTNTAAATPCRALWTANAKDWNDGYRHRTKELLNSRRSGSLPCDGTNEDCGFTVAVSQLTMVPSADSDRNAPEMVLLTCLTIMFLVIVISMWPSRGSKTFRWKDLQPTSSMVGTPSYLT